MKLSRSQSVVDYKLFSRFEHLRQKLVAEKPREILDKPLAFWTVPNDRRLPLAFMGRSINSLLSTPFEELYATAGVGQKKIAGLVDLLARVANTQTPDEVAATPGRKNAAAEPQPGDRGFDPSTVSEQSWEQWRAAVTRHGLEREILGRFASSLQDLPRVVWNTPLETYINLTLTQIRSLKTHGEKRVRVVVEIFGALHRILGTGTPVEHLTVKIRPQFVGPIEAWIADVLARPTAPDANEIRRSFVEPIMRQVRVDAGETIAKLAEGRLGLSGKHPTVKQAAKRMGLTRARVYQLLNDVSAILLVRWPESVPLVNELRAKLQADARPQDMALFNATVELCFQTRRRLAPLPGSNGHYAGLDVGHQRQAG